MAALIVFGASQGLAAETCDSILDSKLLTQSEIINQEAAAKAAASAFCNMSFHEFQESSGGSAGGSYGIISGNVSMSESTYETWKQENCGSSSSSQNQEAYRYEAQRALAAGVVEAWRACKLQQVGLVCFATPSDDPNVITITVKWQPPGNGTAEVQRSAVVNGEIAGVEDTKRLYPPGSKMFPGEDRLTLVRSNEHQSAQATLTVIYNEDTRHACEVFVPKHVVAVAAPAPAPEVFPIVGSWCGHGPGHFDIEDKMLRISQPNLFEGQPANQSPPFQITKLDRKGNDSVTIETSAGPMGMGSNTAKQRFTFVFLNRDIVRYTRGEATDPLTNVWTEIDIPLAPTGMTYERC